MFTGGMFGSGHRPAAGWTITSGRLEEIPTVAGYLARRVDVRGRCHTRDCRRTCHLDLGELVAKGMGALPVRTIQHTLRCARLDSCALFFEEKPEHPLTIGELCRRDYVGVEIRCAGCGRSHVTNAEGVVARLKAAGRGDGLTKVSDLAGLLKGVCKACKISRWSVAILWFDPSSQKVPSWKQEFDRRRELRWRERMDKPGPPP